MHSNTEDATMSDLKYAGHIQRMTIEELKRISRGQFTEEQYQEMARQVQNKYTNDATKMNNSYYDKTLKKTQFGYDSFIVEVLDFEFMSTDCLHFEEKESRFGNVGFYYKGQDEPAMPPALVYSSIIHTKWNTRIIAVVVIGSKYLFDYGLKELASQHSRHHKNTYVYGIVQNLRRVIPKSIVSTIKRYADMMQLAHLKLQQSIAKAKPGWSYHRH